jgi:hypothetical protein
MKLIHLFIASLLIFSISCKEEEESIAESLGGSCYVCFDDTTGKSMAGDCTCDYYNKEPSKEIQSNCHIKKGLSVASYSSGTCPVNNAWGRCLVSGYVDSYEYYRTDGSLPDIYDSFIHDCTGKYNGIFIHL